MRTVVLHVYVFKHAFRTHSLNEYFLTVLFINNKGTVEFRRSKIESFTFETFKKVEPADNKSAFCGDRSNLIYETSSRTLSKFERSVTVWRCGLLFLFD